ncbi:MAG: aldehyde dehydrogenase family protein [Pseudomonadota bacterium]
MRATIATEYGLVMGISRKNAGRRMRVAKGTHCGQVLLTGHGAGGGIELLYRGSNTSGYGSKKGFATLHAFAQLKTVVHHHG